MTKKIINTKLISSLNPCSDRFDNFKKFYDGKDFTKARFMGLKNITQRDKMWVAMRLLPKHLLTKCTADIAELVLPIFESKYPNELRPRQAIEAARTGVNTRSAADSAYAAADAIITDVVAYAAADAIITDVVADCAVRAAYAAADAAYAADCAVRAA